MNKNLLIGFVVTLTFFIGVIILLLVWGQKKQLNEEIAVTNVNRQINTKEDSVTREEKPKEEGANVSRGLEEQYIEEDNILIDIAIYPVRVYIFHSETCPHCRRENEFFSKLEKELPSLEIERFEISNDSDMITREVFNKLSKDHSTSGSIPLTVIGVDVTLGFDNESDKIGIDLKSQIKKCAINGCDSWLDDKYGLDSTLKRGMVNMSTQQLESVLGK